MGEITVKYYNSAGTKLTSAPKNVGTYTVKIDVAEGDNYEAQTDITADNWTFTITKADPTIKSIATSVTYKTGLTLKDVPYPSTTGNTPGSWSWTYPSSSIVAGTYTYSAKYTPTDTTNYNSVSKSITVTVNKGTPTINSTSTSVTYKTGLTLKDVPYPSTTGNTEGSWAWSEPSTVISSAGTHAYQAVYTPTDTNYNSVTKSITVTVNKGTPTINSTSTTATYAPVLTLAKISLPSTTGNTPGSWAWTSSTSTAISGVGTYAYSAKYTPTDTGYNSVTKSIRVTVSKGTPTIKSTATSATYAPSLTLANVSLPNTAGNTMGSWTWTYPSSSIVAGTYTYSAKYTPTDTTNYNSVSKSITVTVNKGTPTINSTATSATYAPGLTLAKVSLPSTTGNTAGSWTWSNSNTAISSAGTHKFPAKYTPSSTNYNSVVKDIQITITKDTPTADDFNFAPPSNLEHSADYKIATITRKPGVEGIGEPTIKYFTKVNEELTLLEDSSGKLLIPTDVGTYYVGIDVIEDTNYNSAKGLTSDNWNFTVAPAGSHTYQLADGSRIYLVAK